MFLQRCRWKWKETSLPEAFLSYQKVISPRDVFIILQVSRSVRLRRKCFLSGNKREKQHYYKKRKQIRYLNIFNIINILTFLSADAKSAILLRVPSLTKVEVRNFPLLNFPRWFRKVNGQLAMSLRRVKRLVICKFQWFCFFDIQQWSVLS